MPIEARRCLRLALATGAATALGYGLGLALPYVVVLTAAQMAILPMAPPGFSKTLVLVVLVALTSAIGLFLGLLLNHVPVAGVLLMLAGIAVASAMAVKPANAVVASLLILGTTIIAVLAAQSSAAGLVIAKLTIMSIVIAIVIAHIAHAIIPETAPMVPVSAPVDMAAAPWIGLRAALIMLPPVLLALNNPGTYILLLMKGSQLSQQVSATDTRVMARALVGSTIWGGALALVAWQLLGLWPGLTMLVLLLTLLTFLIARPLYGVVASKYQFFYWQNVLVTMILILGPAVADSATGNDIRQQMLIRIGLFIALAVYTSVMASLLDTMRAGWQARVRRERVFGR
jgi:hypothetical protein